MQDRFWALPIISNLVNWAKQNSLPGFSRVPIWDVGVFLIKEIQRFDLTTRATAIAYSFFIALFPSIIALFTLLPYLNQLVIQYLPGAENFDEILRTEIMQIMPGDAGDSLFTFIEDIDVQVGSNPRRTLVIPASSRNVWGTNTIIFIASATSETFTIFPGADSGFTGLLSELPLVEMVHLAVDGVSALERLDTDGDGVFDDEDIDDDNFIFAI